MTLIIGVTTNSGIVLASDSRTSFIPPPPALPRISSDFTHKLVVFDGIAVATTGWATLSRQNIAGHLADFAASKIRDSTAPFRVNVVASELTQYFLDRYNEHVALTGEAAQPGTDVLAFLIGGYEGGSGRLYEVSVPSGTLSEIGNTSDRPTIAWRGDTDVLVRLIKGVDLLRLPSAVDSAGKRGSYDDIYPQIQGLEYLLPVAQWNLQDGIDFAVLAIRTTMDVQRLTYGTIGTPNGWPSVGGPIEIAAIPPLGPPWVQQTALRGERPAGQAEGVAG